MLSTQGPAWGGVSPLSAAPLAFSAGQAAQPARFLMNQVVVKTASDWKMASIPSDPGTPAVERPTEVRPISRRGGWPRKAEENESSQVSVLPVIVSMLLRELCCLEDRS
jgi:hypothetical protein